MEDLLITFLIKSPGQRKESRVNLYFHQFLIGSSSKCHLKLPTYNQEAPLVYAQITQVTEGILLEGINQFPFFINSKKFLGTKKIVVGDQLQFEGHRLIIEKFDPNAIHFPLNFQQNYKNFLKEYPEYQDLLKSFEKELIFDYDAKSSHSDVKK